MDVDSFDQLYTVMTAILYAYLLFTAFSNYFRLRKEPLLFDSKFLCPSRCEISACLDPDGYVEYIRPHMLLTGIFCSVFLLYEVFAMIFQGMLPLWLDITLMFVLPLLFVVYIAVVFVHGAKRYW